MTDTNIEQATELRSTALHAEHAKLGASFTDFGGWDMPLRYGSELTEHHAVRQAAGLFDLSHMGELWVRGPQAAEFLDYALVGKLSAVAVGRAKYSLICNAEGGIVDDLISYRRAEDTYLVVPNAGNAEIVAAAFKERAEGFDVEVDDQSLATSLVAIQGPKSEEILLRLVPEDQAEAVRSLKYYAAVEVTIAGEQLLLARTGYTGEDGFEIYVPNDFAAKLWQELLAAGADDGLIPAGLATRDSLRLEAGMPLYGHELTLDVNPYEAGFGKVVSLAKEGDFVGRAACEVLSETEPERVLVGLTSEGRRAARAGYAVFAANNSDGDPIGEITSGAPSPTLGHPVAMGYVAREHSEPGTVLAVDLRGKPETFTVTPLPFYKRPAKA